MSNFCYWCQRFIVYYVLNGHIVVKLALPTFELAKCTAVQVFGCLGSGSDGVDLFVVDRVKRQRYNYDFTFSSWDKPIESEDMYL